MTKNLNNLGLKNIVENYDLFFIDIWGVVHNGIYFFEDAIKTLDELENAIRAFDKVQNNEQGNLRTIDIILFPAGTIVASGPQCSEAGPGRWLPKPSDTFRIFGEMLKPSVGYKMIPMLWYEMMGVNRVVGFILPDWIADIIPCK